MRWHSAGGGVRSCDCGVFEEWGVWRMGGAGGMLAVDICSAQSEGGGWMVGNGLFAVSRVKTADAGYMQAKHCEFC